jgi:hypothetical protein
MTTQANPETEDMRRDIIAAASLGLCKKEARELLRYRIFRNSREKGKNVEGEYLTCLTKYAEVLIFWVIFRFINTGPPQKTDKVTFTILIENQRKRSGKDQKRSKRIFWLEYMHEIIQILGWNVNFYM